MLPYQPYIKICCIASVAEARMAIAAGAQAVGLVSHMPSGPGVIADRLIAEIAAEVAQFNAQSKTQFIAHGKTHQGVAEAPPVKSFLLTSRQSAALIAEQHRVCNTTTLQLVDEVASKDLLMLRRLLPETELVQVIHVLDAASVAQALAVAPLVDALLLDSGNPGLAVKELGGTGRAHDWRLSQQIVAQSPVPVWLAGGLNAVNARLAIDTVRPYGLDICSGVRSRLDGASALDAVKLAAFIRACRAPETS